MLVVPSPRSHSPEVIGASDTLLKFTVNGALPDSTSIENEAEGGMEVAVRAGSSCSARDGVSVDSSVALVSGGGAVLTGPVVVVTVASQAINKTETRTAITPFLIMSHLLSYLAAIFSRSS